MIEYLHDAIRASAGTELNIVTRIVQDNQAVDGVCFVLHLDDEHMFVAEGIQDGEAYQFIIPAEVTSGLSGRYWYCFQRENEMLCFKQPIYLV